MTNATNRAARRAARKTQEQRLEAYLKGAPWGPFVVADFHTGASAMMNDLARRLEEEERARGRETVVFINAHYQVAVAYEHGQARHLSIKHRSNYPIHDWRDFQRIKNELVGPEAIAVEVYPPESQLVDGSNQYHLFVVQNYDGIGFHEGRMVCYESDPREPFHRQAPLLPDYPVHGPVLTIDEIHRREQEAIEKMARAAMERGFKRETRSGETGANSEANSATTVAES